MEQIHLKYQPELLETEIALPSSKSESNRALIMNALTEGQAELTNLSEARDTQTMIRLLASEEETLDVLDAGTTMRFLTAFRAIGTEPVILTGTKRMQERPVKILVDALKSLGAKVQYLKKDGYPPVKVKPFTNQKTNHIKVKGDISSQYISALLMIAPCLPEGLSLEIKGKVSSRPYVQMTLELMTRFGITYDWTGSTIRVEPQAYRPTAYEIESDWSGASYWYSFVALSKNARVKLMGLRQNSLQGDIAIVRMMNQLGVMSTFEEDGVVIEKIPSLSEAEFDFSDCPDLAQTVAVTCAAKRITCTMTGLESLKIKETDRIKALKKELKRFKTKLKEIEPGVWELRSMFEPVKEPITVKTYDDHRMAMAFAPFATQQDIIIQDPDVVNKSYPSFWDDLKKVGFSFA